MTEETLVGPILETLDLVERLREMYPACKLDERIVRGLTLSREMLESHIETLNEGHEALADLVTHGSTGPDIVALSAVSLEIDRLSVLSNRIQEVLK